MGNDQGRLPVSQAADFVCDSFTLEYRRLCLAFWRERFGDDYADQVGNEVRKRYKPRKR
jgi:hypothetical protein